MNDYLLTTLLGIMEGLTEFLPVSSTAHLRIVEALSNIHMSSGYWKMYTIVIQLGAILCLPVYFRTRIGKLVATFPAGEQGDCTLLTHPLSLTLIAFVVTAIPAFLLTKIIGKHLENLPLMGAALVAGGVVMWAVDARNARAEAGESDAAQGRIRTWRMESMGLWQAVWIGACQILSAVFPGTSRSMATIAAGQTAGMSRAAALEFSFFLSMPTMLAATGYDLLKSLLPGPTNPIGATHIDFHGWILLVLGFANAFIVAYASVAWFMAWVRRGGFVPFAIYRIVLGAGVLIWAGHLSG